MGPIQVDAFEYRELPSSGEKCWINDDFYFIYEFTEKPKIGPAILRIQVFDRSTIIKESHLNDERILFSPIEKHPPSGIFLLWLDFLFRPSSPFFGCRL